MSMFGNTSPNGNNNRRSGTYYIPPGTTPRIPTAADFANAPAPTSQQRAQAAYNFGANFPAPRPTPNIMPTTSPLSSTSSAAERARTALRQRTAPQRTAAQMRRLAPQQQQQQAGGGSGVSSLFAPLFQALDQQLANAQNRYSENAGQIQNIYGQLIGARKADITDIQTAYDRLQKAAASRGAATLEGMETREETRLSQNEAVLESMGVGDIGTSTGDIASQSAAVAQDVERMNQSNWANMLTAMGATSQDIARADMTSFGYAQMEDIAALQAAREDFAQNIEQQRFDLKFQEQQARLQAQQAAAASAARARQQAAEAAAAAEEQQYERTTGYLRAGDPLSQAVGSAALNGIISAQQGQNVVAAFNDWVSKSSVATNSMTTGTKAWQDAQKFVGNRLSGPELNVLRQAVINSYKK